MKITRILFAEFSSKNGGVHSRVEKVKLNPFKYRTEIIKWIADNSAKIDNGERTTVLRKFKIL